MILTILKMNHEFCIHEMDTWILDTLLDNDT